MGPLLFLVYIDDIPQCIKHDSKVAIFAVDSKLFKIIEKPSDKLSLQQDPTQLSTWSDTWKMCLSIPKCKALNISRKKIPTKREYHLNGSPLATVSKIKDLGITVTNTLQGSQHIKLISSKANKMLGLIRRVCSDINDPDIKKLLYCSIVQPQLEYACELWSPYTSKDKLLPENVQCNATKFILNYARDISYRDRLLKRSLLPLEYRREMKDLVLIYNARAGYIDLGHQDFFCQTVVRQKMCNSSELNYQIPHAKQNYLKCLFYYRSINFWHKLPRDIKSVDSFHTFKRRLLDFYVDKTLSYNLPSREGVS